MSGTSQPASAPRLADAEMAIAIAREEINKALAYKTNYNADGHNICLALINFRDCTSEVLTAYSNDSAIPESTRLGLNLVPNTFGLLPTGARYGCDGMAQFHTEPKLLNFICASPNLRGQAFRQPTLLRAGLNDSRTFFLNLVNHQRHAATDAAARLQPPGNIRELTLVSEIDCCTTCITYSIQRFRAWFPSTPLNTIELGKIAGQSTPYQQVRITRTPPRPRARPPSGWPSLRNRGQDRQATTVLHPFLPFTPTL